jgi:outer membrane protein assembly factor BamA
MTNKTIPHWRAFAAALTMSLASVAQAQTTETEAAAPLVVQAITCAGNANYSCEFIRDHLHVEAGQPLDEEEIRNAELRLSSLRNFSAVSIRLEKGAQRGAVIVVIEVEEASPITTESLVGASSRLDMQSSVFAVRIANQNLFGEGKLADLGAVAIVPVSGDGRREAYNVTLRYVDPQLFDSSRYFAIARASWSKSQVLDVYGNFSNYESAQLDFRLGRRFGDFSYLMLGVLYRPNREWTWGGWAADGTYETEVADPHKFKPSIAYGWSTEDDLYFPTQGTTLQLAANGDYGSPLQFRKTWASSVGFWTIKVGGDPSPEYRNTFTENQLLALTYARPITPGDNILRGRWYVEPGFSLAGNTSEGERVHEYGIKAGFRADTRAFGLVDLYVIGSVDPQR